MSRWQKNNIKRPKLHGVNNVQLTMLIAKQTKLVKIKQAQLAKLKNRLKYKQANSLYQKFGVSSLMPKRNPKVEVRREARREFRKYWKGVIGVEGYKSDIEYIENWREEHSAAQKSKFPAYNGNVWEKVLEMQELESPWS